MDLAEMVRTARESSKKTKQALADEIGVAHSTIVRIEAGEFIGRPATLHALAVALDLDPGDVLRSTVPSAIMAGGRFGGGE